jgi:hypothetical protein
MGYVSKIHFRVDFVCGTLARLFGRGPRQNGPHRQIRFGRGWLSVARSSDNGYAGFTLEPMVPGYEGLAINFGPAEPPVVRQLMVRLARMIVGIPSSVAFTTKYDM